MKSIYRCILAHPKPAKFILALLVTVFCIYVMDAETFSFGFRFLMSFSLLLSCYTFVNSVSDLLLREPLEKLEQGCDPYPLLAEVEIQMKKLPDSFQGQMIQINYALALVQTGSYEKALEVLEAVDMDKYPNPIAKFIYYNNLCDLMTRLDRYPEADSWYRKSLEVLDACRDFTMIREVFREGIGYLTQADYEILRERYAGTPMWEYVMGTRQVLPGSIEDFLGEDDRPVGELFFLTDSPESKEKLRQRLSALPDITFADPFPNDLEVLAGGIDKGEAFLWLLSYLGIDPSETLAMGDGGSDIPLLQAAGIGIAMGNALDYVKAAADDVTASCDEDGVALALEKYILHAE